MVHVLLSEATGAAGNQISCLIVGAEGTTPPLGLCMGFVCHSHSHFWGWTVLSVGFSYYQLSFGNSPLCLKEQEPTIVISQ